MRRIRLIIYQMINLIKIFFLLELKIVFNLIKLVKSLIEDNLIVNYYFEIKAPVKGNEC